jgi:hypothetical protein
VGTGRTGLTLWASRGRRPLPHAEGAVEADHPNITPRPQIPEDNYTTKVTRPPREATDWGSRTSSAGLERSGLELTSDRVEGDDLSTFNQNAMSGAGSRPRV